MNEEQIIEATYRMLQGERPAELDKVNDLDIEQAIRTLVKQGRATWDDSEGEYIAL